MQHLIAQGLAHKFPPEWQKKVEEALAPFTAGGRTHYLKQVRFVTYTLKYPNATGWKSRHWNASYDRALVDATKNRGWFPGGHDQCTNLTAGHARPGQLQDMTVVIDKQEVTARPWGSRAAPWGVPGKAWRQMGTGASRPVAGKPGPRTAQSSETHRADRRRLLPTVFCASAAPANPGMRRRILIAEDNLRRFRMEWGKYWRGKLPVKDDVHVTRDDVQDSI